MRCKFAIFTFIKNLTGGGIKLLLCGTTTGNIRSTLDNSGDLIKRIYLSTTSVVERILLWIRNNNRQICIYMLKRKKVGVGRLNKRRNRFASTIQLKKNIFGWYLEEFQRGFFFKTSSIWYLSRLKKKTKEAICRM